MHDRAMMRDQQYRTGVQRADTPAHGGVDRCEPRVGPWRLIVEDRTALGRGRRTGRRGGETCRPCYQPPDPREAVEAGSGRASDRPAVHVSAHSMTGARNPFHHDARP